MGIRHRVVSWLPWYRRRVREVDLERELRDHLDLEAEEQQEAGLSPEEAAYAARRALGNTAQIKEDVRMAWGFHWLETLLQDLRYGLRQLRHNPGFTIVAVFTLCLGIGASTSIFSIADAVLLRPLPYPNPQQIVRVWEQTPNSHRINLAQSNFDDFRTQNNTFATLAEYEQWLSSVSGGSEPVRVNIANVSSDFFKTLGVEPFRGRLFAPDEQRPHGAPAVIVSYDYWQRYLGGAADLSEFRLRMERAVYPIIGAMPAGFDFPPGAVVWISSELEPEQPNRGAHNWRCLGRVRDGVTVAQARANLSAIAHRLRDQYGEKVDLNDAAVVPLADAMVEDVQTALLTLLGAVGLLLLVACTNVAGLLVASASARRKELAVRAALGAGRGRLIQQFLAESFALSFAGGVLGIVIASWAVHVLPAILPTNLPLQQGIAINAPVLLFALAATVVVAVSLGLFAGWRAGGGDLQEALTAASRTYAGSGASQRLRSFLVIGEIATTLVILIGAGLLGRSFLRLIATSPGFSQQNLITLEFSPPSLQWQAEESAIVRQAHLMDETLTRLRAIPGVESVGLASGMPVGPRATISPKEISSSSMVNSRPPTPMRGVAFIQILPRSDTPSIAWPARSTSAPWAFG